MRHRVKLQSAHSSFRDTKKQSLLRSHSRGHVYLHAAIGSGGKPDAESSRSRCLTWRGVVVDVHAALALEPLIHVLQGRQGGEQMSSGAVGSGARTDRGQAGACRPCASPGRACAPPSSAGGKGGTHPHERCCTSAASPTGASSLVSFMAGASHGDCAKRDCEILQGLGKKETKRNCLIDDHW